ncbi:MAG: glycosyltransferase family 61 protein [Lachnospiraceae bacterium]|nr:glycosyltransferase family 61 protein [Lachnospiraceae bacterium]
MKTKKDIKVNLSRYLLKSDIAFSVVHFVYRDLLKLRLKSLYDYAFENHRIVSVVNDEVFFDYYKQATTKEEYETWQYKEIEKRECSRQFISIFKNAIVRGDTDAVIVDGCYLTDKIIFDRKGFEEHLPWRFVCTKDMCIIKGTGSKIRQIPFGISLIKMWSYNYFHFVFEGLSRLGEIEKLEQYKKWPIIIDECVKKDPRNVEIINLLNINNREIIWVKQGEFLQVGNLIQPPTLSWAVWDVPKSVNNAWGYMLDKKTGEYLRNTVLTRYTPKREYNCVFVARGNNKRLINEDEIIEYFEEQGFSIFYPDKAVHFQDEVDCFATANCIVSCAGGASTNFVFCKPSVDIYCLLPFEFRCDNPQDVTQTVGINSHMIDGVIKNNGGLLMSSTFEIPLEKCKRIVDACKEKGYL